MKTKKTKARSRRNVTSRGDSVPESPSGVEWHRDQTEGAGSSPVQHHGPRLVLLVTQVAGAQVGGLVGMPVGHQAGEGGQWLAHPERKQPSNIGYNVAEANQRRPGEAPQKDETI